MPSMYDTASLLASPIGSVCQIPATGVPPGYLLCDGSAIDKTVYALLFTAIGTAHGEPIIAGSTFNIPDYRGRFLRGLDNSTARDPNAGTRTAMNPNGLTGSNIGTLQGHAFNSHTHTLWGNNTANVSAGNRFIMFQQTGILTDGAPSATFENRDAGNVLNSGGSETRPLNAYINYMIRAY